MNERQRNVSRCSSPRTRCLILIDTSLYVGLSTAVVARPIDFKLAADPPYPRRSIQQSQTVADTLDAGWSFWLCLWLLSFSMTSCLGPNPVFNQRRLAAAESKTLS